MVAHLTVSLNSLSATLSRLSFRLPHHVYPTGLNTSATLRLFPFATAGVSPRPAPAFVAAWPVAQKYRSLLGSLDWAHFPNQMDF
jgi:hypothetical protein